MQELLGVNKVALNDLAKRGIVKRGERRGTYARQSE
jgi:DNA-binding GntR family transcriptional regulator